AQRWSGAVAEASGCGIAPGALGRRDKTGHTCRGMQAFRQQFHAIVQDNVWNLRTSLPDSAPHRDREGPFVGNELLVGGTCCADWFFRSSRSYPDVRSPRRCDCGKMEARTL